jgi:hypothetical protein
VLVLAGAKAIRTENGTGYAIAHAKQKSAMPIHFIAHAIVLKS